MLCRMLVLFIGLLVLVGSVAQPAAAEEGWRELTAGKTLDSWKNPHGQWEFAAEVTLDPKNPKQFQRTPGGGILVNGPTGRTNDLVTRESFADIELHLEFVVPKGSNSGVKFEGLYEIQIMDSHGAKNLSGDMCGGIYPRAEFKPKYRHIDKGTAPRVNAARPAGEWQTLDVIFQAPRFDAAGKKTANARFVKVTLNGQVIHENVEVPYPTGHAWTRPEIPKGPLLLQGDHGPVAFRNVRVREYVAK